MELSLYHLLQLGICLFYNIFSCSKQHFGGAKSLENMLQRSPIGSCTSQDVPLSNSKQCRVVVRPSHTNGKHVKLETKRFLGGPSRREYKAVRLYRAQISLGHGTDRPLFNTIHIRSSQVQVKHVCQVVYRPNGQLFNTHIHEYVWVTWDRCG